MAEKSRRNHYPRKHTPDGVNARYKQREDNWNNLGSVARQGTRKPGSRNPRKVGR